MRRARPSTESRPARGDLRDDDGSASLEFLTVGVLLLVPIVYLVLTIAAVQAAALGVEGAARQASRVFVQAPNRAAADAALERAVLVTLADYGIAPGDADVRVSCTPAPADCLTRQGFVTVEVSATVPLPLVPPILDLDVPLGVAVHASATEQVSRFRADG